MTDRKLPQYPEHHGYKSAMMPNTVAITLLLVVLCGVLWQFNNAMQTEMNTAFGIQQNISYEVKSGRGLKQVAEELHQMQLVQKPWLFTIYGLMNNGEKSIKKGMYEILPGDNPKKLLQRMLQGDVAIYKVTFPEGITFNGALQGLRKHKQIRTAKNSNGEAYSDAQIMHWLGQDEQNPEGWFYPDTYNFPSGTSDLQVLRMAHEKMKMVLQQQWEKHSGKLQELVYDDPYQILIMASIIQSEGIYSDEFAEISGVFHRRLQQDIPLYSDPTVAYAHALDEDGMELPLRRRHMKIDSPYNTYKYGGLPPSPIALPSTAAIRAAFNPQSGDTLYFVALGNGRHHFSKTLKEHNRKRIEIKELRRQKKNDRG